MRYIMTSGDGSNGVENGFYWIDGGEKMKNFYQCRVKSFWLFGKVITTTLVVSICESITFNC